MKRLLFAGVLVASMIAAGMAQTQQQDPPANTVSVEGQVMKPGTYQAQAGHTLTVVQLMSLAGGFTKDADKRKVSIARIGVPENITIDLQKVLTGSAPDVPLQSGDVIRVPEFRRR